MFTFEIEQFDLKQIAQSGQCFRMNRLDDALYSVVSQDHYLEIKQENNKFTLNCEEQELPFWKHYFDLHTNYAAVLSSIKTTDAYLSQAGRAGAGIRILNQQPFEMIITFILSQQKTIPKIKEAVESLAHFYGTKHTVFLPAWEEKAKLRQRTYFAFPTPKQLRQASLADLQALKLGYRAKYIDRICQDTIEGKLDLSHLAKLPYPEAMEYLTSFFGIGKKVANCICLFGLHHIEAFPVDTWIEKILTKYYYKKSYENLPKTLLYSSMIEEHFGSYKGYAGIMQQYLFYYERVILQGNGGDGL